MREAERVPPPIPHDASRSGSKPIRSRMPVDLNGGRVPGFMDELMLQTRPASALNCRISGAYVFSGVQVICHRAR
jgi:hypothetical protein